MAADPTVSVLSLPPPRPPRAATVAIAPSSGAASSSPSGGASPYQLTITAGPDRVMVGPGTLQVSNMLVLVCLAAQATRQMH